MDYTTLSHGFDVLAQQVPDELPQVEAAYRAVARCQGRVVCFHATLTELPALFGMANQGFNTRAAICKAGVGLRVTLRQTCRYRDQVAGGKIPSALPPSADTCDWLRL